MKIEARWLLWPFKAALRLVVIVAMLFYVFSGMTAVKVLYKKHLYSVQDIDAVYALITNSTAAKNTMPVTGWLGARPLSETDKLIEMITPHSTALEPGTFFEIFRRELKQGRPEEALFWLQLGRYRLRFDVMRCKTTPEQVAKLDNILNKFPSPEIDALLRAHPEKLKKALQRVLDFDAKYPPTDDPTLMCRNMSTEPPADTEDWGGIRAALRRQTKEFINSKD